MFHEEIADDITAYTYWIVEPVTPGIQLACGPKVKDAHEYMYDWGVNYVKTDIA